MAWLMLGEQRGQCGWGRSVLNRSLGIPPLEVREESGSRALYGHHLVPREMLSGLQGAARKAVRPPPEWTGAW